MPRTACLEPLEPRIAPALVVANPIADLIAGAGKPGATIELSHLFDADIEYPGHTLVKFTLNLDADPNTPGIQNDFDPVTPGVQPAEIVIELFDDEAPLSVQNFLRYVESDDPSQSYLNTFLHRLFDFGTSSQPGMDIIQGGGFKVDAPAEHIPTFGQVHNEYSDSRPNTAGTIAMAKTGLSPNTATSEWFINLNDNTSILNGSNNGGFTVFGQVVQGLDILQRLASLAKANRGGALTDLPVQNYDPDPDNNPSTPTVAPKLNNFIRITDVEVLAPEIGNTTGIEFTGVTITDAETGMPSDVVTAIIDGTKLILTYAEGMSGVVNVEVSARDVSDNAITTDTFQVTVRPNLVGSVTEDAFQAIVVPGDTATAKVQILNNAAGAFIGSANIKVYLSKSTSADPNGTIVDEDDILVGSIDSQALDLGNGEPIELSIPVTVPRAVSEDNSSSYRLIVEVVPEEGSTTELFVDDNNAVDGDGHALRNQFGTITVQGFGTRKNAVFQFEQPDEGGLLTLSLKGKGTGTVTSAGDIIDVVIDGTNMKSILERGGDAVRGVVNNLEATSFLGTVNFGTVDVAGHMAFSGGIQKLILGSAGGDKNLVIGQPTLATAPKAVLKLGTVQDLSIESLQPIATINATEWLDTMGADDIVTTVGLSALKITGSTSTTTPSRGDFEADIFVEKRSKVNTVQVAGLLNGSNFFSLGNVGSVRVGGMVDSTFFAGVQEAPETRGDLADGRAIGSFIVNPLDGVEDQFVNSTVAAKKLGTVKVRGVDGDSGTEPFGFVADSIVSYKRVSVPGSLLNQNAPIEYDVVDQYAVRIL